MRSYLHRCAAARGGNAVMAPPRHEASDAPGLDQIMFTMPKRIFGRDLALSDYWASSRRRIIVLCQSFREESLVQGSLTPRSPKSSKSSRQTLCESAIRLETIGRETRGFSSGYSCRTPIMTMPRTEVLTQINLVQQAFASWRAIRDQGI